MSESRCAALYLFGDGQLPCRRGYSPPIGLRPTDVVLQPGQRQVVGETAGRRARPWALMSRGREQRRCRSSGAWRGLLARRPGRSGRRNVIAASPGRLTGTIQVGSRRRGLRTSMAAHRASGKPSMTSAAGARYPPFRDSRCVRNDCGSRAGQGDRVWQDGTLLIWISACCPRKVWLEQSRRR